MYIDRLLPLVSVFCKSIELVSSNCKGSSRYFVSKSKTIVASAVVAMLCCCRCCWLGRFTRGKVCPMVDGTNGRFDGRSKVGVNVSAGSREHRRHWHRRRAQQLSVDEVAVEWVG